MNTLETVSAEYFIYYLGFGSHIFDMHIKTCKHDEFTNQLMNIYKTVLASDTPPQRCVLGLHRSDYMQHEVAGDPRVLLQVELNTIASSFGSLSAKVLNILITSSIS